MMSRRGGKRRQVLQLGNSSSKLHRYGYTKGFQSKDSAGPGLPLNLVGDYSDSDPEDKVDDIVDQQYDGEVQDEASPEPDPVADINGGGDVQNNMDDELQNFLSEIEAIPMPDETKTPDSVSNGSSPAHPELPEEPHETTSEIIPNEPPVSKKKASAYSMFVKGEMEFAHSPTPSETDSKQEETKETSVTEVDDLDIPDEPTTLWQMVQDEATQYYYYWNWQTNEVTWEIPSDYTQYLLLHKEYEMKMAKFTPEQLKAIKDKKASKTKQGKAGANSLSTAVKTGVKNNDALVNSDLVTESHLGKDSEERSHSHHHKKKKSKKHKRRHEDSDEDIDGHVLDKKLSKILETEESDMAASPKEMSKMIGPQALSIVPYLSDEDGEEEELIAKPDIEPELSVDKENSRKSSPDLADFLVDNPNSDTDAMVQDLVEFADSVTRSISDKGIGSQLVHNDNMEGDASDEIDVKTGSESTQIKAEVNGFGILEKVSDRASVVEDSLLVEKASSLDAKEPSEVAITMTDSKLDELPVKKETKIKKEIINMFEDDSPPAVCDNNVDEVENKIELPAAKMEIEEGEISDSLDSLLKPPPSSVEFKESDSQKEKKSLHVPSVKEKSEKTLKEPASLVKGIVGYSEDDEEEEGELKEESLKAKIREELRLLESKRRDKKKDDRDRKKSDKHSKDSRSREHHEKAQNSSSSLTSVGKESKEKKSGSKDKDALDRNSSRDKDALDRNSSRDKDALDRNSSRDKEVPDRNRSKDKDASDKNSSRNKEVPDKNRSRDKDVPDKSRSRDKDVVDRDVLNGKSSKDRGVMDRHSVREKEENKKTDKDKEIQVQAVIPVEETPVTEKESALDDTEDIDFDDLDDIDRVLEMALEKKRDQKTQENKQEVAKKVKDASEVTLTPNVSTVESKTTTVEPDKAEAVTVSKADEPSVSDIDNERLKSSVKDSAELALNKLRFLDISTKNLSKLQVLLIELQTRLNDWQGGGLSTSYFHQQLQLSEALLSQYEESAVPSGWLCQWDRASSRYFYLNQLTNQSQWEYPEDGGGESKGKEDKEAVRKKRKSKEDEREEVKARGNSSSRSSRHRSKKTQDKERSKRDRHSSSAHHHRKKKRRRREHSSSSSSSEDESSQSRHRHKSKRKKRSKSDRSPSLEVIGESDGAQNAQVIEDSPPPSSRLAGSEASALGETNTMESEGGVVSTPPQQDSSQCPPLPPSSILVADYGSEQDVDKEEEEDKTGDEKVKEKMTSENAAGSAETEGRELDGGIGEEQSLDGEEMKEDGVGEEEEEEQVNSAVIIRAPQIIVPPSYVAAMNQPQMYAAPSVYPAASVSSTSAPAVPPVDQDKEGEATQAPEDVSTDKASKKKKKDKAGKEKSLSANSSIMMKKKRVSSMVQKWQQVKKEVEKEDRAKELRQAAIREKINQLK